MAIMQFCNIQLHSDDFNMLKLSQIIQFDFFSFFLHTISLNHRLLYKIVLSIVFVMVFLNNTFKKHQSDACDFLRFI